MFQEVLRGTGKGGELEGRLEAGRLRAKLEPESWVLGHRIRDRVFPPGTVCLPGSCHTHGARTLACGHSAYVSLLSCQAQMKN